MTSTSSTCFMARSTSSFRGSLPSVPSQPLHISTSSSVPTSPVSKSLRKRDSVVWEQEQQRQILIEHLEAWALDHDSSPFFQGTLSCLQPTSGTHLELGTSVSCVLTNNAWTDARKRIVIRLFPPKNKNAKYRLVVRSGSSWLSAREYLSKEYFAHRRFGTRGLTDNNIDSSLKARSINLLGSCRVDHEPVIILRPLFHPFLKLPLEIQQMALGIAVGKRNKCWPTSEATQPLLAEPDETPPLIPLATVFKISKSLNEHMVPWIFATTDFHFHVTGFTNFLWQCGPSRRAQVRKLTFEWGSYSLLHCIRWLAPDPIFELFEPPVHTNPHGLQYMWRCQIQDLAKEIHLLTLTIKIRGVKEHELAFIARILCSLFGGIERLQLIASSGREDPIPARVRSDFKELTWRELCRQWYEDNQDETYYFSNERRSKDLVNLEEDMDQNKTFFDRVDVDPDRCCSSGNCIYYA